LANPVYLTDNGTDISTSVDWKSIDMASVLTKEVSTLKFNIRIGSGQTYPAKTIPAVGDTVKLYDSTGIIFGGTVTEVEATIAGLMLTWQVTCTDYSYLFDGTLVKKNYAMMDPAEIVADIVTNFAPGKGFTTNHVQTGNFLVPSIKFNYQQPTKCLESLAKLIGWDWYIDPNKDIHFFLGDVESAIGEGGVAPVIVDGITGDIEWNSLDVDLNLQNMQNSVYVIGGNYTKTFTAGNTPDTFLTDGVAQFYSTSYPYNSSTITVTLDGVAQTVGIANQTAPGTVQVLYNDAQRWVEFTGGAPGSGHTVKVYGKAKVPIVAHAGDASSIATYGEYQTVIVDIKITSVPEAQQRAQAAILQFGHPVYDVKFNTLVPGCAIGQAITVNLPAFGINKQLVIKRVEAVGYVPGPNGKLEYQVECIGSDKVTFTDLMTTLLQQEAAQTSVDDSTVNENLEVVPESIVVTESVPAPVATSMPYTLGAAAKSGLKFVSDALGTLLNNLVSYFNFDGNSEDIFGSNNGSDTAMTYGTPYGKVGEGALFNGTTSLIALSYANIGTTLSYSGWFKMSATSANQAILSFMSTLLNVSVGGTVIQFLPDVTSGTFYSASYAFSPGTWYHVAVTHTGTTTTVYINGVNLGSQTTVAINTGNISSEIGSYGGTRFFTGDLDEVGIWSRALTQAEITELYNAGNGNTMVNTIPVFRLAFARLS